MLRHKNVKFALHNETPAIRSSIPLNLFEKIGTLLSWLVYGFGGVFLRVISDPRFITICFTLLAMLFTAFLFYPFKTFYYFFLTWFWMFDRIHWGPMRLILWLLSEVTIFGLGIRALGRFSNRKLMEHHGLYIKHES